ncbi:DUF488 domain-containing protein [Caulobacter sp. NIBR2454]|uniref:DUF488 domain-containing protein n=1 Tax=Caulobacter sp. NIBR2454 TaxID=3015996 RepID=UPI0022B74545|nr:DUF488 domain-containing protein [Caulobacter sp. NIBR2454]
MHPIFTVGYQSDTQGGMIQRLKAGGVKRVIDVRAVASSRKAGFSKSLLAASLNEAGIEYVHLKPLGTPKPGRDAARAGRIDEMREIFETHMEETASQLALNHAEKLVAEKPSALLCYEDQACDCHRAIVADKLKARLKCEVVDL